MRRIRSIWLLVSVTLLIILSSGLRAQTTAPRYQLTDLGALTTFANSRAYGLNEKGEVVGQVAKIGLHSEAHAVLWKNGKIINIENQKDIPYGIANAINEDGMVVGGSILSPKIPD